MKWLKLKLENSTIAWERTDGWVMHDCAKQNTWCLHIPPMIGPITPDAYGFSVGNFTVRDNRPHMVHASGDAMIHKANAMGLTMAQPVVWEPKHGQANRPPLEPTA